MQIREIGVRRDLQIGKGLKFSTVVNLQKNSESSLTKKNKQNIYICQVQNSNMMPGIGFSSSQIK